MRIASKKIVAGLLIGAMVLPGCASRNVPPMGLAGKAFKPDADELRLWAEAEKEEAKIAKQARLYEDPLLEEYLATIGDRLTPDHVKAAGGPGLRFSVLRDPTLNAFAMPNGHVYLHTGLLARLDNEAQLATILGHELTHVDHRHALRFNRDARNKMVALNVAAIAASIGVAAVAGSRTRADDPIGAAVLGQTANVVLGLGLQLVALAAINGYGRDLEREADAGGMEKLMAAGYDPREAPKVFELLKKESGDRGALETFFFGNHPKLEERIRTTRELLQTKYPDAAGTTGSDEFALRMRPLIRENALLDIRAGRFALAQEQLDRVLAVTPKDATAQMYYGDLHRLQSQRSRAPEDRQRLAQLALDRYERAATLDPKFPDPWRQLGLLYYQQKDPARAREAFQRYLELKPDAPDGKRIKEYLVELDR
jgi:beta-barrel assembly-enhancing protease